MAIRDEDNKIVSISFNNKQFLDDVQVTIKALERLNDATSGKSLKTDGIDNLTGAFTNLNKSAINNIESINNAVSDTSAYSKLSDSVEESSHSFNILEGIALGVLIRIGDAAINIALRGIQAMTSGIRSGWGEYNLIMDSTQTIMTNTGESIDAVTKSLDELNRYADLTIYNFSQMTRNMGYFTTSGMDLTEAQNMVQGMSNVAAMFGANNESLQRAMYQTSQGISSGMFRKMDWKSLQNASMSGKILQDELIRVAALMSGRTYDSMNDWITSVGGFYQSLDKGWLTSEIFSETMRRFAGMTREEVAAIRDLQGNALSDEEIDRIVKLGEEGWEAATKVRTLHQMLEAVGEAIGSGWAQTFRTLVGNLDQAKEFWTPINDIIAGENGIVTSISNFRNEVVSTWATMYRDSTIEDLMNVLNGLKDVLDAVGQGFVNAFGRSGKIAQQIGLILEPLGDLTYTFRLTEEELQDVTDLVEGLLSPFVLFIDIIKEFVRIFFNAGDAMNEFDTRTDSLADSIRPVRKMILDTLGAFGRFLSGLVQIIRATGAIRKAFHVINRVLRIFYNTVISVGSGIYSYLVDLWNRFNMTDVINNLLSEAQTKIVYFGNALLEVWGILKSFLSTFINGFKDIDFTPLNDFFVLLDSIGKLIRDLSDPTITLSDAFENLKENLSNTSVYRIIVYIRDAFASLIDTIRNSSFGPIIDGIISVLNKLARAIGGIIYIIVTTIIKIKDIISNTDFSTMFGKLANGIWKAYDKIKNTKIDSVFSGITRSFRDSINELSTAFSGNKVLEAPVKFVSDVRDALTVKGDLPENNVFKFVNDITENVKSVSNNLTDSKTFEPIKAAITDIKDVITLAVGVSDDAKESGNSIKAFEDVKKDVGTLTTSVTGIGDFFSSIGTGIYNKVSDGLSVVSNTLSIMASGERYEDLSKAQRFKDIINMLTGICLGIGNSIIGLMGALSLIKWADAVEEFGKGIKQFGKARKWYNIRRIFESFAVLAVVLMAGAALISIFGDMDSFYDVLGTFTVAIVLILGALTALVGLVIGLGGVLTSESKIFTKNARGIINSVSKIFRQMAKVLSTITMMVVSLSIIAIVVANLGVTEDFKSAMQAILVTFAAITALLVVVTLAVYGISRILSPLKSASTAMTLMSKGELTDPLDKVIVIFKKVANTIVGVIWVLAFSALIIGAAMKISGMDTDSMVKILGTVGAIVAITIMIMAGVTTLLSLISLEVRPESMIAMTQTVTSIIGTFNATMWAIGLVLVTFTLSFVIMTQALSHLATVSALVGSDNMKSAYLSLFLIGAFLGGITAVFILLISMLAKIPEINHVETRFIKVAAGFTILAAAMAIVVGAFTAFTVLTALIPVGRLWAVFTILSLMLAIVGGILIGIALLIKKNPMIEPRKLIGIAGSLLLASSSLLVMAGAILMIVALPIGKLWNAFAVFVAMTAILGGVLTGLTFLATMGSGAGGTAMLVASASMIMMSTSILILGKALLKAAESFALFNAALGTLQNLNANKIKNNLKVIVSSLPDMLRVLIDNFGLINTWIVGMGVTIGNAVATAIFTAINTFNTLIVGNIGAIVGTLDSIIVGLIYGRLLAIKTFMETIVQPGSVLWEILDIVGRFLTEAAEYLGYYGTLIITEFMKGIINACYDMSWDLYIIAGINNVWTSVQQWFIDHVVGGFRELLNDALAAVNMMMLDNEMEGYQQQLDDIQAEMRSLDYASDPRGANDRRHQLERDRADVLANMERTMGDRDAIFAYNDSQTEEINAQIAARNAELAELRDAVNGQIDAEIATRRLFEHAPSNTSGYSTYIPDQYRGLANDVRSVANTLSGLGNPLTSIGNTVRNLLGMSEGESVGSMIFDALGLGGDFFSNGLSNLFGDLGSTSGSSFANNFGDALSIDTEDITSMDPSNFIKPDDFSAISDSMNDNLPSDTVWTISPVLDSTEFKREALDLKGWWDGNVYDEFAIDAGNSMLLREQASADAATNGEASVSFTQNIFGESPLDDIKVYRDTRSIIRGAGNFSFTN